MPAKSLASLCLMVSLSLLKAGGTSPHQSPATPNYALLNGQWFNGQTFEARTFYSVNGRFTAKQPTRLERTLDLAGMWIVPPFAEAHNHNIDGAHEARSRQALQKYLADGVFYVKIQGNFPLTEAQRTRLPMNRPDSPDVALAQTFLTATDGHPIALHENVLLPQGYYPGLSKEGLKDALYFTLDSAADLTRQWPRILALRPDFIKANLWCSDEFALRKDDPAYPGRKALDPRLLPKIVAQAHAAKLRVSVHITNAADFHHAVAAGVDEIAHSVGPGFFKVLEARGSDPRFMNNAALVVPLIQQALSGAKAGEYTAISVEDAKLAGRRGIVVVTTLGLASRSPEPVRAAARPALAANLKLLHESGVVLAIGSDNVADTSVKEFEGLHWLGVFNDLTLLKLWTETTARTIFPQRRIGALKEGYEASFLALAGNPLEDWQNVRKIKLRFKQGVLLEP